jgi:hypothetical protein
MAVRYLFDTFCFRTHFFRMPSRCSRASSESLAHLIGMTSDTSLSGDFESVLSISDLAARLGVPIQTIYDLRHHGRGPHGFRNVETSHTNQRPLAVQLDALWIVQLDRRARVVTDEGVVIPTSRCGMLRRLLAPTLIRIPAEKVTGTSRRVGSRLVVSENAIPRVPAVSRVVHATPAREGAEVARAHHFKLSIRFIGRGERAIAPCFGVASEHVEETCLLDAAVDVVATLPVVVDAVAAVPVNSAGSDVPSDDRLIEGVKRRRPLIDEDVIGGSEPPVIESEAR